LVATVHQAQDTALPVVLLHGLSQQRRFWDPVVTRLSAPAIATLDQRGHGQSLLEVDADYRIERCAEDVIEFLDEVGWERAVIVGHSWGAWIALRCARNPRTAAIGLIDGGLWGLTGLGAPEVVRERLRPPELGIPAAQLWAMIDSSAPYLDAEGRAALADTFVEDASGLVRTRIGVDRHMRVLDGLLQYEPEPDLQHLSCPAWAVICEPKPTEGDAGEPEVDWEQVKSAAVTRASGIPGLLIHRWMGAVHDVPLQWPALVAGFVDALRSSIDADGSAADKGSARGDGSGSPRRRD